MIISISGRKHSGKTTLSSVLLSKGFVKVSFADVLKQICSTLYSFSLTSLYDEKEKEARLVQPVLWDDDKRKELEELAEIKLPSVKEEKQLYTRREVLQFIGSDILRSVQPDFHVLVTLKRLQQLLLDGVSIVLDDVRFPNELAALKTLGAYCVFVFRPNYFVYDNHQSETALNHTMFDYVIINDKTQKTLEKKFSAFVNDYCSKNKERLPLARVELLVALKNNDWNTAAVAKQFSCSRDKIIYWCERMLIPIPWNRQHPVATSAFLEQTEEVAYLAGLLAADGCITHSGNSAAYCCKFSNQDVTLLNKFRQYLQTQKPIYYKQSSNSSKDPACGELTLHSPYLLENLKLWNLRPRKSKHTELPALFEEGKNTALLCHWFVGLVDGDGSVDEKRIRVLVSTELASQLQTLLPFGGKIYKEKQVDNLCSLNFHGENARQLCSFLSKHGATVIGSTRKWNRLVTDPPDQLTRIKPCAQ